MHLRTNHPAKTYVPLTGFSERPPPALPSWVLQRTKGPSRGEDLQQRGPLSAWSKPTSAGVKVYQPSYFYVSSMRKKAVSPGEPLPPGSGRRGLGLPGVGVGSGGGGGTLEGYGMQVLPRVTGMGITPVSPRSGLLLEDAGFDNLDSASMLGALEYHHHHHHQPGGAGGGPGGGGFDGSRAAGPMTAHLESTTPLDAQSVVTDHTLEERSVTLPFQVTFSKAPPRGDSRRPSSPKSVRFSLPPGEAAAAAAAAGGGQTNPQWEGGGGSGPSSTQQAPPASGTQASSRSSDGGSVVDGFFVQPASAHPAMLMNRWQSPGGGDPQHQHHYHQGVGAVGSVSTQAPSSVSATPSTLMRTRGALSNARQVPGRYFPPLALNDDNNRFSPMPQPSTSGALPASSSSTGRRVGSGSCVSSSSAPPALGAASITQLHRGGAIPSFAVVSSHSWSPNNTIPAKTHPGDNRVTLKPKTFALGSPGRGPTSGAGRDRGMTPEDMNRDSQRDTVYNRNKKGFWEMYDADPGRFTISFREENPSYDPTSFLHSDYYTVRRSVETPTRGITSAKVSSRNVKKTSASPFHGCLEGTTKRLHTKKTPRTLLEP